MFELFSLLFKNVMLLLGYLSNNNSFPKPLSKKEETELLKRMKEGDEKREKSL